MKRPLRVAHLVATAGRSGVESHLLSLLPAFDRTIVEPCLFVPGSGPLVDSLAELRVPTETGAPTRKLAWLQAQALAARLRGRFDVLHAHGPRAAFWGAVVARAAAIPRLVCTVHELRWRSLPPGLRRTLWIALEAWAMRRASRLIVLSRDSEGEVRRRFPDLAGRLTRIAGSIPLLRDPARITLARPGGNDVPMRIVAVGRLEWVKRHDRLLEALAQAIARGAKVELHIAGGGPLRESLLQRGQALGIERHVRWLGETSEVPGLLASGHVYASASMTEAFPIATLEAMAVGLPIVTCDNGGGPELVEGTDCGIVIGPKEDPPAIEGLADAFVALAKDPARRAALGAAASQRARERYSATRMAQATTDVYLR